MAAILVPLLLLMLLWLWSGADAAPAVDAQHGQLAAGAPAPTPVSIAPDTPPASAIRHDVGVPVEIAEADLDHPFAYHLEVRVVDADGLPVENAMVFAAPPDCGFALWPDATDASGKVLLHWQARTSAMELHLLVLAFGVLQPLRSLPLVADQQPSVTFAVLDRPQAESDLRRLQMRDVMALDPALARQMQLRPRQKKGEAIDCGRTLLLFRAFDCNNCHEPSRIAAYQTLARAREARTTLHPQAVFGDLGTLPNDELERRQAELQKRSKEVLRRQAQRQRAVVSGIVTDADGKPANKITVAWLDDGALRVRTVTDETGRYRIDVAAGNLDLFAGGGDGGTARGRLIARAGDQLNWNFALQRSQYVLGWAFSEANHGLWNWRIEWLGEDGGSDVSRIRANGWFELGPVSSQGSCLLWAADNELRLPVRRSLVVPPDSSWLELRLSDQEPARARLRLRPRLPSGHDGTPVDIRIWQHDTGRGAWLQHTGRDERFELGGLPAGWYSIEVGAPKLGWVPVRKVCVDGTGQFDLGNVLLPTPGRVRLVVQGTEEEPFAQPHAFLRRTTACDVAEPAPESDGVATIPAGEHVVVWRQKEKVHAVAFMVGAGELATVTLPAR